MTITLFRTSGVIIPEIRQPTFALDRRTPSAKRWVLDGISRVKRVPNNNCSIDQPVRRRITYDTNIIVPNVLFFTITAIERHWMLNTNVNVPSNIK